MSVGPLHPVGGWPPTGSDRSLFVAGLVAKVMYLSLQFAHQRAVLGLFQALLLRLSVALQRRVSGRLKLH